MLDPKSTFVPENEQGVVAVVGQYAARHGWAIAAINTTYPDALMTFEGREYRVEFEFTSSNFIAHGHDPRECDLIVCWRNDTPDLELPVIEVPAESWDSTPADDQSKLVMYWRLRARRAERERDRAKSELAAARPMRRIRQDVRRDVVVTAGSAAELAANTGVSLRTAYRRLSAERMAAD